jgi:MFS family permease
MSPETNPYARRWQALIVLAVSLLVISVGNTILNVALPTIQTELDASSSELQWIVDGYLLVYAGLLLAAGTLGDRFGRRRALVTGLVVFAAGSVLAALSDSSSALIASRALMGVGAAHAVAAQAGGSTGADLVATANQAFIDAMTTTAGIAAAIAVAGALIAAVFLPARARSEPALPDAVLPDGAAA